MCTYLCMFTCVWDVFKCEYEGIYMCIRVYEGIYMCVHVYEGIYTCAYVCVYVFVNMCLYLCMFTCVWEVLKCVYEGIYMCVFTSTYVCVCVCVCVCMNLCVWVLPFIHLTFSAKLGKSVYKNAPNCKIQILEKQSRVGWRVERRRGWLRLNSEGKGHGRWRGERRGRGRVVAWGSRWRMVALLDACAACLSYLMAEQLYFQAKISWKKKRKEEEKYVKMKIKVFFKKKKKRIKNKSK